MIKEGILTHKRLKDFFIIKDGEKLNYGYTTGSCATAAAKSACEILLSGQDVSTVSLKTPFGIELLLDVLDIKKTNHSVTCAIQKDAGDDPDVTHGILVFATVEKTNTSSIVIDGGVGVGRVTRLGLEQKIGEAAINKTPRAMIRNGISEICQKYGYDGGVLVTISIPDGVELAKKTFNPRLGIQGGISVLGTSGIVVPMSEEALVKSIEVEMKMRLAEQDYLLVTPGNYGEAYLKDHTQLPVEKHLKCSNFVGKTIEMAVNHGAKGILFVANIGKFVKVAGGVMDTHSKSADCRAEIMSACAIRAGGSLELAHALLDMTTTEEGLASLQAHNLLESTMAVMMERIHFYLKNHCDLLIGAIVFSNQFGFLGQTQDVEALINQM